MTRSITSLVAFMFGGLVTFQATYSASNQGSGDNETRLRTSSDVRQAVRAFRR